MKKWLNKKIEEFKRAQEIERILKVNEAKFKLEQELKKKEKERQEIIELRLICINNVRYINSYINVLTSNSNTAKGKDASSTKKKREFIRKKIEWLKTKLVEEEGMVQYYNSLINL